LEAIREVSATLDPEGTRGHDLGVSEHEGSRPEADEISALAHGIAGSDDGQETEKAAAAGAAKARRRKRALLWFTLQREKDAESRRDTPPNPASPLGVILYPYRLYVLAAFLVVVLITVVAVVLGGR
jgi:hypothetical protein